MGLNDSYAQVRGQLLLMDPIPPINKVFALVTQEENQRNIHTTVNDPVTFSVKHGNNRPNQGRSQKMEKSICSHCGFTGHTIDKCYKLHGYPLGYRPRQRNITSNQISPNQLKNPTVSQISESNSSQSQGVICNR